MILADERTEDVSDPPKVADRRCRSSDDQKATTMNKVLINCHKRQVNKYFIFVLALTLVMNNFPLVDGGDCIDSRLEVGFHQIEHLPTSSHPPAPPATSTTNTAKLQPLQTN